MDASIARIEAVDRAVNALPLHRFESAHDDAKRLQDTPPADRGLLAGLPIAIKDLIDVEGMPTTYGCPLFTDNVAAKSDPLVTRLEARGGIVVGKSNSPEMGMMPVTTNRVFGHTRNPWNLETTPGDASARWPRARSRSRMAPISAAACASRRPLRAACAPAGCRAPIPTAAST